MKFFQWRKSSSSSSSSSHQGGKNPSFPSPSIHNSNDDSGKKKHAVNPNFSTSVAMTEERNPPSSLPSSSGGAPSRNAAGGWGERAAPKEKVGELREVFEMFDANGDGKISWAELGAVLRSLGDNLSEQELHLMVEEVDENGDGFVDFKEFLAVNASGRSLFATCDELRDAFRIFDSDKNGLISADELHQVLGSLGQLCSIEECRRMISEVDRDGDGFVDFAEFERMMTTEV